MRIKVCFFLLFFSTVCFCQNYVEALRYSQSLPYGTSKFSAMAGAFGALGGDLSSITSNPASVAVFNKSEYVFGFSLSNNITEANYFDNISNDSKYSLDLGTIGAVFIENRNPKANDWNRISFSVGCNTKNIYDSRQLISGYNSSSSLADVFYNEAQGVDYGSLDLFSTQLAYYADLIDTVGNTTTYETRVPVAGETQTYIKETRGFVNEYFVNAGAKFQKNLYIGASIGIPVIDYYESTEHSEFDFIDPSVSLNSFQYNNYLNTMGVGINFKAGLIYRPAKWLRLGAALHSPTWYSLNDEYNSRMQVEFLDGTFFEEWSPYGEYDYTLSTPFKTITSAAFIFGKYGLISIDYELMDYSLVRLRSDYYNYTDENQEINQELNVVSNFRLGTEWRFGSLSVRGGLLHYSSPYVDEINNASTLAYSFGAGFREKKLFIDFSFLNVFSCEKYYIYESADALANLDHSNKSFSLTVGYRY